MYGITKPMACLQIPKQVFDNFNDIYNGIYSEIIRDGIY